VQVGQAVVQGSGQGSGLGRLGSGPGAVASAVICGSGQGSGPGSGQGSGQWAVGSGPGQWPGGLRQWPGQWSRQRPGAVVQVAARNSVTRTPQDGVRDIPNQAITSLLPRPHRPDSPNARTSHWKPSVKPAGTSLEPVKRIAGSI
ncbi:merozoite surface antigen 2-like, partial [Homarus americanus]|uniref:merozoite surface antigen 2-like n=1 Tax=Homarus americanus TaxID=6706 RepID=UPI001C497765